MANDEPGSLLQRHLLLVAAARDPRTTKGDLAVLSVITEHARSNGEAHPGILRIASMGRVHRTSVPRCIERLEALGYLTVERQLGRVNVYWLQPTSSMDAAGTSSTGAATADPAPAAPPHTTSSKDAAGTSSIHASNQQHGCCPNSALELSSSNSEKRTQLPAAPFSVDQQQELAKQRAEQKRLAEERRKAEQRESIRQEYIECRRTHPDYAKRMEQSFPRELADLIEARP